MNSIHFITRSECIINNKKKRRKKKAELKFHVKFKRKLSRIMFSQKSGDNCFMHNYTANNLISYNTRPSRVSYTRVPAMCFLSLSFIYFIVLPVLYATWSTKSPNVTQFLTQTRQDCSIGFILGDMT